MRNRKNVQLLFKLEGVPIKRYYNQGDKKLRTEKYKERF